MTAVQVLQNSIEDGSNGLGANTFQVQKEQYWQVVPSGLKSLKWKDIRYPQGLIVKEKMALAQSVALNHGKADRLFNSDLVKTNPTVSR